MNVQTEIELLHIDRTNQSLVRFLLYSMHPQALACTLGSSSTSSRPNHHIFEGHLLKLHRSGADAIEPLLEENP